MNNRVSGYSPGGRKAFTFFQIFFHTSICGHKVSAVSDVHMHKFGATLLNHELDLV